MRRICVFCGANSGFSPVYAEAAAAFGRAAVAAGLGIVTGGGQVGLMGAVADAALEAGGEVIGVIPHLLLRREVGHERLTELRVVETMHERKATMASLSDAFVALPGGIGTMEETFEVWTWSQLGVHTKPVGVLDVGGYYAPLLRFIDHMNEEGFLRGDHRDVLLVESDPERMIRRLGEWKAPPTEHVVDRAHL